MLPYLAFFTASISFLLGGTEPENMKLLFAPLLLTPLYSLYIYFVVLKPFLIEADITTKTGQRYLLIYSLLITFVAVLGLHLYNNVDHSKTYTFAPIDVNINHSKYILHAEFVADINVSRAALNDKQLVFDKLLTDTLANMPQNYYETAKGRKKLKLYLKNTLNDTLDKAAFTSIYFKNFYIKDRYKKFKTESLPNGRTFYDGFEFFSAATVNLLADKETIVFHTDILLKYKNDMTKQETLKKKAQIQDLILAIISSNTLEAIHTPVGRKKLRELIARQINIKISGDSEILDVAFHDLVLFRNGELQ